MPLLAAYADSPVLRDVRIRVLRRRLAQVTAKIEALDSRGRGRIETPTRLIAMTTSRAELEDERRQIEAELGELERFAPALSETTQHAVPT